MSATHSPTYEPTTAARAKATNIAIRVSGWAPLEIQETPWEDGESFLTLTHRMGQVTAHLMHRKAAEIGHTTVEIGKATVEEVRRIGRITTRAAALGAALGSGTAIVAALAYGGEQIANAATLEPDPSGIQRVAAVNAASAQINTAYGAEVVSADGLHGNKVNVLINTCPPLYSGRIDAQTVAREVTSTVGRTKIDIVTRCVETPPYVPTYALLHNPMNHN